MIKTIRIIWRKIRNDKALSFLKFAGLVLAFVVTIPLICNIRYQTSFDRFHEGADRIYNVYIDEVYHGTADIYGECPLAMGAYLKDLYPEVESMVRTKNKSDVIISKDDETFFTEDVIWTDPSFIDVFSLEILSGNKHSFLHQKNTIYISKSLSDKLFADKDPIGRMIKAEDKEYIVSGVFKDYPRNSFQQFSALASLEGYVRGFDNYSWESYEYLTYVKLKSTGMDVDFERKAQTVVSDYLVPWLKTHYNLDYVVDDKNSMSLKLLPVSDIHLRGSYISSFEKESQVSVVYISFIIVVVILLIAYFNLLGFAFSKGKKHHFQINIKRFLGSPKSEIIKAFIAENLFYTLVAFMVSCSIFFIGWEFDLPLLSELSNVPASNYLIPVFGLLLFAGIIAGISGIVLGWYFNRNTAKLKESGNGSYSTFWLNRAMLITQLAASIVLFISISVIYKQMKYISEFDLGIDTQNVVVINQAYKIRNQFDAFKNELKKSPFIQEVSRSNSIPFSGINTGSFIPGDAPDQTPYPFPYFQTDISFQDIFKYEMKEGRWFSEDLASEADAIVMNEAAVQKMGFTEPLGKEFYNLAKTKKLKVIGVVKDFNFQSLHHKIQPLVLVFLNKDNYYRNIVIKGNTADRENFLAEISEAWEKVLGNEYMNYSFLEDRITLLYEKEAKAKQSIFLFSLVAILISCFGLLGTVLNISNEKTKEIGIRKVNGAKVYEILAMLNNDFVKWIVIAFVIATPVAYFAMNKWLENFAYKTNLSWWIFALAGVLALGIALLTVSWQSWKAATRNPVEALRYE